MTFPITPNQSIHQVPNNNTAQKMLFTNGQLQRWAQNLPLAMTLQLVDAILKALGETPAQIAAYNAEETAIYDAVQTSLSQTNTNAQNAWNQLEAFLQTGNWSDLTSAWNDFLKAIFGSNTNPSVLGMIAAPTVANTPTSAQIVPDFPNSSSIQPGGGWSWDNTVQYQGEGFSAKVVADGTLHALEGIVAPVQPGQVVTLTAQVQWTGLTTGGSNPIQLQLIPWSNSTTPGTAVQVASIASPGAAAAWTNMTGTYTVPPSGVQFVQMQIVVNQNALTGTVWWADCVHSISGGFLATMQADLNTLQSDAQAANAATQTFLQAIVTAIQNDSGNWPQLITDLQSAYQTWATTESKLAANEIATLQQMFNAILGINPNTGQMAATNVQGVGGFQSLYDTFVNTYNQLGAALGGDVSQSGGLAWLAQLMNDLGVSSTSPLWSFVSTTQSNNQTLSIVNNRPASAGLEATVESNGNFQTAASLSTQLVAQTTSRGTCITVSQAKTLGFVQWLGNYTSAPTGFVINFYKMDSSGNLTYLSSSPDLSATISSGVAWYLWDLTTPITANAGDVIGVEFQIKTSGTVNAYGYTAPVAANHPTAAIKQLGFSQNWAGATASTISSGSIGWSQYAPYVGLGVGTPPPTPYFPQQNTFTTSTTYTIQSWSKYVDLILLGAGGGGEGETGVGNGPGGTAGSWATTTLTVGTSGPSGIASGGLITITIGSGGAGGPYFTPGSAGTATVLSWKDSAGATQTLTANGGLGGSTATNLTSWGLSPGNVTYPTGSTNVYIGGGVNAIGGTGNAPGGGGSGGAAFQFGFAGARGQAWTVDRQT